MLGWLVLSFALVKFINAPAGDRRVTMNIRPEYKKKSIRSYVVRAGRMTEGQKAAFDKYWSVYGLSLHNGKVDAESTFGRRAPQVLEIGFGMGGSLLQMVQAEQEKDFIGIEVHPPGAGRLINDAGKLVSYRTYACL